MSEETVEEIPETKPVSLTPCPTCTGTGEILIGWDEEGEELYGDCVYCVV